MTPETETLRTAVMSIIGLVLLAFALHYHDLGGKNWISVLIGLVGIFIIYDQLNKTKGAINANN
jgi:membrane-bound ClpP family serine protease